MSVRQDLTNRHRQKVSENIDQGPRLTVALDKINKLSREENRNILKDRNGAKTLKNTAALVYQEL